MRLDPATIAPLVYAVRKEFGATAKVWLFGSRADAAQRGGDIDLYIETDTERDLVEHRSALLRRLEGILGEQKIDLSVRPRSREPHPLHLIAREQGVLLQTHEDGSQ